MRIAYIGLVVKDAPNVSGATRHQPSPWTEFAFAALLLGMLLAQLDTNIVVAALPAIASDLHAGSAIAGVTAAYLLTVTASTPVLGKLGDVLGRRPVFIGSVLIFAIGSVVCAIAPSMPLLIAARALQGVGGAGLVVTAVSTIGILFDKTELIRRQVWLTGVTAVSALAGPPLGGYLAEAAGWPAIFLVNVPLAAIAILLGFRGLPGRTDSANLRDFDVVGTMLITVMATSIVLLGSFDTLAHSPIWSLALLLLAIATAICFVMWERRAQDPLVPPSLFASSGLSRSIVVTGLGGVALFGTFTFVPLVVIAGTGYDGASVSGMLVALTAGQLLVTATFSVLARKYSRMAPWGRLGIVLGVVGLGSLAFLPFISDAPDQITISVALMGLAISGAALGLLMQAYTLLGITTAPPAHFGSAMATLTFARQLGGALGAALFGWLLITLPDSPHALTIIFAAAAGTLVVGFVTAPRTADEPEATPSWVSVTDSREHLTRTWPLPSPHH